MLLVMSADPIGKNTDEFDRFVKGDLKGDLHRNAQVVKTAKI